MINYILKGRNLLLSHVEYKPDNFDSLTSVPVIIQLHGVGEGGVGTVDSMNAKLFTPNTYLKQVAGIVNGVLTPTGKQFPFLLICPQAENGNFWTTAVTGYNSEGVKNDEYFSRSLLQYIKGKYKGKIDVSRIYTVGYSAGGRTAVTAAACKEIAGVLAACPALDSKFIPETVKDVPIKFFQNTEDKTVPYSNTFTLFKKLSREINSSPKFVDLVLNTGGHDAWSAMFADEPSLSWLLSQRLPEPTPPKPEPVFDYKATEPREYAIGAAPGSILKYVTEEGIEITVKMPEIVQNKVN